MLGSTETIHTGARAFSEDKTEDVMSLGFSRTFDRGALAASLGGFRHHGLRGVERHRLKRRLTGQMQSCDEWVDGKQEEGLEISDRKSVV